MAVVALLVVALTDTGPSGVARPVFDHVMALEAVAETTANASLGDVNGDGRPDIVAARSGAPSLLFFNDLSPRTSGSRR
jgi:hypothetical protein